MNQILGLENRKEIWLILISFFTIYIVWGSTYLANAWGIKAIPPFLFAGARFTLAGLLLLAWSRIYTPFRFTKKQIINTVFAGFILFAIGNGMVVWALQYVDTGLTALIVSCEPLLVAIFVWMLQKKKPVWQTVLGIGLGMLGMLLLIGQPDIASSIYWWLGVGAVLIGITAWSYIAVWVPTAELPSSIAQSAALQMFFGGISLFIWSMLMGEYQDIRYEWINQRTVLSFFYLVFFGSIFAFSAYNYLLMKVSTTKVVTAAYVNPVVALILGWGLNNENISSQSLLAAGVLLTGVFFINSAKK